MFALLWANNRRVYVLTDPSNRTARTDVCERYGFLTKEFDNQNLGGDMRGLLIKSNFHVKRMLNCAFKRNFHNVCFIHIPKTGGKSLLFELENKVNMIKINKNNDFKHFSNFGSVTFGHVHYLSLVKSGYVSNEYHHSSYKFAIVRNPYDRIVSLYNYLTGRSELGGMGFDQFLDQVLTNRPPVGLYNKIGISQANPQVDWIADDDGQLLTDDVFKVEEIGNFQKKFKEMYDVHLDNKRRKNVSKKFINIDERFFSKKEAIEKINHIYKKDFMLFGYEMA